MANFFYASLKTRVFIPKDLSFNKPVSLGMMPTPMHIADEESFKKTAQEPIDDESKDGFVWDYGSINFYTFDTLCGIENGKGEKLNQVVSFIAVEKQIDSPETDTMIYCVSCLKRASFIVGVKEQLEE